MPGAGAEWLPAPEVGSDNRKLHAHSSLWLKMSCMIYCKNSTLKKTPNIQQCFLSGAYFKFKQAVVKLNHIQQCATLCIFHSPFLKDVPLLLNPGQGMLALTSDPKSSPMISSLKLGFFQPCVGAWWWWMAPHFASVVLFGTWLVHLLSRFIKLAIIPVTIHSSLCIDSSTINASCLRVCGTIMMDISVCRNCVVLLNVWNCVDIRN